MDFGFGSYDNLSEEHFQWKQHEQPCLPGNPTASPELYFGLSKWGDTKWVGKIYPKGIKNNELLTHYAQRFNAIELNSTHYQIPAIELVNKWHNSVESNAFHFCPKFPKLITHQGPVTVENKKNFTSLFLDSISAFGNKLGPSFIQLSDKALNKNNIDPFLAYLDTLPKALQFFLEIRQPYWLQSDEKMKLLVDHLSQRNIGMVITDTIERRDAAHMRLSIPHAFIRFVCKGNEPLDQFRIHQWQKQLKSWFDNGLKTCHFFFHVHEDDLLFKFADDAIVKLKQALN